VHALSSLHPSDWAGYRSPRNCSAGQDPHLQGRHYCKRKNQVDSAYRIRWVPWPAVGKQPAVLLKGCACTGASGPHSFKDCKTSIYTTCEQIQLEPSCKRDRAFTDSRCVGPSGPGTERSRCSWRHFGSRDAKFENPNFGLSR